MGCPNAQYTWWMLSFPLLASSPDDCRTHTNRPCLSRQQDDFDDDAALARYREQRLQELREKAVKERFGEVLEIRSARPLVMGHAWVIHHPPHRTAPCCVVSPV